jgi:hypothetical protein
MRQIGKYLRSELESELAEDAVQHSDDDKLVHA